MEKTYYWESNFYIDPYTLSIIITVGAVLAAIGIIAHWKIFTKAGKPGWASLIPIYNLYVLLKIIGKRGWYMLWLFVPIINIIVAIKIVHYLSRMLVLL